MLLGVHVSAAGSIYEAVERAHALGCNTMQIFSRNPQRWSGPSLLSADAREFGRRQQVYGIKPVFVHIPYLINLASPEPKLYHASIEAYIEDIFEVGKLKADYIVTHMGSHKETSEEEGLARLTAALDTILAKTKDSTVGILLENTSGAGSWLGYTFAHQREVIKGIKDSSRIGLCIDTAHAYAAGYDIASKKGLEGLLAEIETEVGLPRIKLIHLNDTQEKLGSHRDRHAHIGDGNIGLAGMKMIVNHPALRNLAFILETPKDSEDADARNLKQVRALRKEE